MSEGESKPKGAPLAGEKAADKDTTPTKPRNNTAAGTPDANGAGDSGEKRKREPEGASTPTASSPGNPKAASSPAASSKPGSMSAASSPRSPRDPNSRKIGIAVDLSDESAYALKWAVKNYLRPTDYVILLHVRPTSVLYGADWGASDTAVVEAADKDARLKMEDEFDALTVAKTKELATPLDEAGIAYRTHIVKDHDMKERICLEVERSGVSACIMGSRGFGAAKRSRKARLGSVSDYCVHHCDCPVVVVRMPEDKEEAHESAPKEETPETS